jgi:hypothetical protein
LGSLLAFTSPINYDSSSPSNTVGKITGKSSFQAAPAAATTTATTTGGTITTTRTPGYLLISDVAFVGKSPYYGGFAVAIGAEWDTSNPENKIFLRVKSKIVAASPWTSRYYDLPSLSPSTATTALLSILTILEGTSYLETGCVGNDCHVEAVFGSKEVLNVTGSYAVTSPSKW